MKTKTETNEKYHSSTAISASGLKTIYKKSVYHFLNQKRFETSAMALGTAVHTALLEPELFDEQYYVLEKIDKRTKAGKEAYLKAMAEAGDKILLTLEEKEKIDGIIMNFRDHDLAVKYADGTIELSHYLNVDGVDVRVRPDVINRDLNFISDVKTCQDNTPIGFKRAVYKFGYHLQAAFYSDMLEVPAENFRFIAVETNYPYSVEVYGLSAEMIEQGRQAYKEALSDWKIYQETGIVSGFNWTDLAEDGAFIL